MHIATFAALAFMLGTASLCHAQEAVVRVQRQGETIIVDVEMSVAASVHDAWSVLTDYEHMASFLSNLNSSSIVKQHGNSLEVSQAGQTKVAFMSFSFAVTRAVKLVPMREIHSDLVSGDFKSYTSTTRVIDAPPDVKIVHHGEYVPKAWMPPMIGTAIIESETRKQYGEIAAEILRRNAAAPDRAKRPPIPGA